MTSFGTTAVRVSHAAFCSGRTQDYPLSAASAKKPMGNAHAAWRSQPTSGGENDRSVWVMYKYIYTPLRTNKRTVLRPHASSVLPTSPRVSSIYS